MNLTEHEEKMWNRFADRWGTNRRAAIDFTLAMSNGTREDQEDVLRDGQLSEERRSALRSELVQGSWQERIIPHQERLAKVANETSGKDDLTFLGVIQAKLDSARAEWENVDNWPYTDQVQICNKTVNVCARIDVLESILKEVGYLKNPQFSYGPIIGAPNLLEQAFDQVHDGLGRISDIRERDSARRSLAYIYDMAKIGAKTPARPFKPVQFSQQEEPWSAKRDISALVEVAKPDRYGHVVLPHNLTLCFKTAETVTLESPEEDLAKLSPEHREMLESGRARAIVTKLEPVVEK